VSTRYLVSVTGFIFVKDYASFHADDTSLISLRVSILLGASQHLRGARAKNLGWKARPVVFEEWTEEGLASALAKLAPLQN
jgi:hypothetical protein